MAGFGLPAGHADQVGQQHARRRRINQQMREPLAAAQQRHRLARIAQRQQTRHAQPRRPRCAPTRSRRAVAEQQQRRAIARLVQSGHPRSVPGVSARAACVTAVPFRLIPCWPRPASALHVGLAAQLVASTPINISGRRQCDPPARSVQICANSFRFARAARTRHRPPSVRRSGPPDARLQVTPAPWLPALPLKWCRDAAGFPRETAGSARR